MEQKTGLHIWTARKENRRWEISHRSHRSHRRNTLQPEVGKYTFCSRFIIFTVHNKIPQIIIFTSMWRGNMTSMSHLWLANQTKPKQACGLPSPANQPISLPYSSTMWTHWFCYCSYSKYPNHSRYSKLAQLEQPSQKLEFCSFLKSSFSLPAPNVYTHIVASP